MRRRPVRLLLLIGVLIGVPLVGQAMVAAETPGDVVEALADDGVFVAPSRSDLTEADLVALVGRAAGDGVTLAIAAPEAAVPDAEAFAVRLLQRAEYEVVLVIDEQGGLGSAAVEDRFDSRLHAAASDTDDLRGLPAATRFLDVLLTERVGGLPPFVDRVLGWVVWLAIGLVVLGAIEVVLVARRRRELRERRADAAAVTG